MFAVWERECVKSVVGSHTSRKSESVVQINGVDTLGKEK